MSTPVNFSQNFGEALGKDRDADSDVADVTPFTSPFHSLLLLTELTRGKKDISLCFSLFLSLSLSLSLSDVLRLGVAVRILCTS